MTPRETEIEQFLKANGFGAAVREPLPSDASFRRYIRLSGGPEPVLLMDAPPGREDVRPFITVANHLAGLGFSAPRIVAADAEKGLVLVEDFGEDTFTHLLAAGADETALYELAIDALIDLHRRPATKTNAVKVPAYDDPRLMTETRLLTDWYAPAVFDRPLADSAIKEYEVLWSAAFPLARKVPDTLVLRDFHVDNLMRLPSRDGVAACGLLDFQDAVIGPVTYDIVSLLEDARRDLAPGLKEKMTARYLAAFPKWNADDFTAASAVLAAQRNAKIIGIFTRLLKRDSKPVYLRHIPRVWRLLEGDLTHPALKPLKAWFDEHLPPETRRIPEATVSAS
jgi:hypothetical protein